MPLDAILFDLDDTLLDWSHFHGDWDVVERYHFQGVYDYVHNEVHALDLDLDSALEEFGTRVQDSWRNARNNLRAPHVGRTLVETFESIGVPENLLNEQQYMDHYKWGPLPNVEVFPEVPEILELLIEKNIKIGIVTNAGQPMSLRDRELETYGLIDYFPDCRISAADAGYVKPHTVIFEKALNMIQAKPEETVFIGDNPVADIAGAQKAGMKAILRKKKNAKLGDAPDLVKPDYVIYSLTELPRILDEWYPGWSQ